jgi:hypothetical protein
MRTIEQENKDAITYQSYQDIISQSELELKNTKWYDFKFKKILVNRIKHYEELKRKLDFEMLLSI